MSASRPPGTSAAGAAARQRFARVGQGPQQMAFNHGVEGLAWAGWQRPHWWVSMPGLREAALEVRICSIAADRSAVVTCISAGPALGGKNPVPAPASSTVAGGAGRGRRSVAVCAANCWGRRGWCGGEVS